MRTALAPLTFLALAACVTVYPPDEAPASSGVATAGFGQTARVGPLRVTPLALLEDSRCPALVKCVWAGQVRITARVKSDRGERTVELVSNRPVAAGSGMLVLENVGPPRAAPGQMPPRSAYRFTFRYTANIMPR